MNLAHAIDAGKGPSVLSDAEELARTLSELACSLRETPPAPENKNFFESAETFLSHVLDSSTTANRDLALCLLGITRYHAYTGNAFLGLEPALRAVAIATNSGDKSLIARAQKLLGAIYLDTSNYPDAVTAFSKALQASKETGDLAQEGGILSNLGLAYQYSGHYGQAIPCYERAADITEDAAAAGLGSEANYAKAAALSNLSLACLQMQEHARGIDAAERAIAVLDGAVGLPERILRSAAESYLTRLLIEVRNLPDAREHSKLAREFAVGTTELAQMFADMAQGLVEVHELVTRDVGLSRMQSVVDRSRKGAAIMLRDALATIVRGYEIAGQPNSAMVFLHEMVELNRDSRVKHVLQHHQRHLAHIRLRQDAAAERALDEKLEDLKDQRLSMDALHECMLVLEKNTVAAELHDDETGEHCYRVGALAKELAIRSGMDREMCTLVDLSARLHDIGKLRIPDSILLKPGKFTPGERELMETHTRHGWELIGQAGLGQLFVAQEIALNHHERWDGSGYPNRRQGNMIPLAARVTALADVFDALTHKRCYKDAWRVEDALLEIARLRGAHFDPDLTDIFLKLVPALQAMHGDLDSYLGAAARENDFITERARVAREIKTDFGTFDVRR